MSVLRRVSLYILLTVLNTDIASHELAYIIYELSDIASHKLAYIFYKLSDVASHELAYIYFMN